MMTTCSEMKREYTKSNYIVDNKYLNNFFPTEDSLMVRLIILGNKK